MTLLHSRIMLHKHVGTNDVLNMVAFSFYGGGMRKLLVIVLLEFYGGNVFALEPANLVTDFIKGSFHEEVKKNKPPLKGVPNPTQSISYTSGDKTLQFAISCFNNVKDANQVVNGASNEIKTSAAVTNFSTKNFKGYTLENGVIIFRRVQNCSVTTLYVGDPSNGVPKGKSAIINAEMDYLDSINK